MTKYDLTDLGYKYKGISSTTTYKEKLGPWTIIDIPKDVTNPLPFVKNFIKNIVAVEIPTSLNCNLRCRYCYISDPRFKNKLVTKEQVSNILINLLELFPRFNPDKSIREQNNKSRVFISPWGAEPFANIPTLESAIDFCQEYFPKDYNIGTSTNGTIWNERVENIFKKLFEDEALKVIQVSLDGPQDIHDFQRPDYKGEGSYDLIHNFCQNLHNLGKSYNLEQRPYSFCSTIHLIDDKFSENWVKAAKFFSEPNKWYTSLPVMPSRMSGEDLSREDHIEKFIEAQKLMYELILERAKEGITVIDFYTYKLFSKSASIRSRNSYPYCSALNSQVGIDVDGSLYPCHGPITSPQYKPFLWYGNIFEKVISYKQLMRNFSYQYGTLCTKGKCNTCPLYIYADGSICWSCPSHNLALTGEPSTDSTLKCIAFNESFKYWVAIAKLTIENPRLLNIPKDWYNCIDVPKTPNKKIPVTYNNMHFSNSYDGLITKALDKWFGQSKDHEDIQLIDSWWIFDNFKEKCSNDTNKV